MNDKEKTLEKGEAQAYLITLVKGANEEILLAAKQVLTLTGHMKRRQKELKDFVSENWRTVHGLCRSSADSFCEYAVVNHTFLTELADKAGRLSASEAVTMDAIEAMRGILGLTPKPDEVKKA